MNSLSGEDLKKFKIDNKGHLLDVRTTEEYALGRIEGAQCIPLDALPDRHAEIPRDKEVLVYCRSGNRSQQAIDLLKSHGFTNLVQVEGGIQSYQKAGGRVVRDRRGIPIMQQVQVAAGLLVLLGLLLAWLIHPLFLFLTGFVGIGLTFAGLSGYCGMAKLLGFMPWNRSPTSPPMTGKTCL